ncbi:MAG TPA: hypothetical protein VND64_23000 [Pirellulales bacterium]|nr:hypothetical protein [Pirellulales bacterium]
MSSSQRHGPPGKRQAGGKARCTLWRNKTGLTPQTPVGGILRTPGAANTTAIRQRRIVDASVPYRRRRRHGRQQVAQFVAVKAFRPSSPYPLIPSPLHLLDGPWGNARSIAIKVEPTTPLRP